MKERGKDALHVERWDKPAESDAIQCRANPLQGPNGCLGGNITTAFHGLEESIQQQFHRCSESPTHGTFWT